MRHLLALLILLGAWARPCAAEESPLLVVDSVPPPGATISYLIGRPQSAQALRAAQRSDNLIFVMHGDMGASRTGPDSASNTGTLCRIVSLEETPVGVNTRLEGLRIVRASSLPIRDGVLYAEFPPQGIPIPRRGLPLPGSGLSNPGGSPLMRPGPHPQPVFAATAASFPRNPAPGLLRDPSTQSRASAGDFIDVNHGTPVSASPQDGGRRGGGPLAGAASALP